MNLRIIVLLLISSIFPFFAQCQSWSLARFESNPLLINPAEAGNLTPYERVRFAASIRYQNSSQFVKDAAVYTMSADFDLTSSKDREKGHVYGLGVLMLGADNLENKLNSKVGQLSLRYGKELKKKQKSSKHYLNLGADLNISEQSLAALVMLYPDYYEADNSTPDERYVFLDGSLGISWSAYLGEFSQAGAGVSLRYLNQTDFPFAQNDPYFRPMPLAIYLHANAVLALDQLGMEGGERWFVRPSFVWVWQHNFWQTQVQATAQYNFFKDAHLRRQRRRSGRQSVPPIRRPEGLLLGAGLQFNNGNNPVVHPGELMVLVGVAWWNFDLSFSYERGIHVGSHAFELNLKYWILNRLLLEETTVY